MPQGSRLAWARADGWLTVALGGALLLGFLHCVLGGLPLILDEGNHLATARVILDGGALGRDSNYIKLGAYLSAAWLGVCGETLVVARVYVALVGAALGVLLWVIVRRRVGRLGGLAGVLVFGAWSVPQWPVHSGDWSGVLTGLLAVWGLLRYAEQGRLVHLVAAGVGVGLTGAFVLDLAAYLLLAGGVTVLVVRPPVRGAAGDPGPGRRLVWLLAGLVAVVLPLAAVLAAAGLLGDIVDLVLVRPFLGAHPLVDQYLPYPTPFTGVSRYVHYGSHPLVRAVFLLPPLALAAGAGLVAWGSREDRARHVVLLAGAGASLLTMLPRSDLYHLVLALPLALPVLVTGGAHLAVGLRQRLAGARGRLPAAALVILTLAVTGLGLAEAGVRFRGEFREVRGVPALVGLPIPVADAAELERLASTLHAWLRPAEPVFAYPDFSMFYFLFPHPPPSRFLDQSFGWFDPRAEEEIVADLERRQVRLAVRLYISRPADGRPFRDVAPRLVGFLAERFREVARFGRLTLLYRSTDPAAALPAGVARGRIERP